MKIILIRHGSKDDQSASEDKDTPLSSTGRNETVRLGKTLAELDIRPEVYLTSNYKHADEMGRLLAMQLNAAALPTQVLNLDSLTPYSPTWTLEDILEEAEKKGVDLKTQKAVAVVGHEARLSELLTRLTSTRDRPFNRAEAACVAAESFRDFLQGTGNVAYRIPVADYQEEELRSKVTSKMTVSTLLAGFTFSSLLGILLATEGGFTLWQTVATICLTTSLALFIASVYMYDRMAMPEGFWVYGDRPHPEKKLLLRWDNETFEEDWEQRGPLYAYMVWTWEYVFAPAIAFGVVGFAAILLNTQEVAVTVGGLAAIVVVLGYYVITRPKLGTD